jgi:multidrug efflux pump subunit AcrA (membrane-fusion protein)
MLRCKTRLIRILSLSAVVGGAVLAPLAVAESNVELTARENIVMPVSFRYVGARVSVGGTVVPLKAVTLTAQLPGRVVSLAGEEGDKFNGGSLLVALDEEDLLAKRRAAEAQWYSADAALRNAGMQHSRTIASPSTSNNAPGGMGVPGMFDQMFTNPMSDFMGTRDYGMERRADVYSSSTQLEQARNALWQAHSQIQQIDAKLRDSRGIAPFDGVIVKKHVEIGDTVQPGQPLLEFADTQVLQIVSDIPARLSTMLRQGEEVPATLDISDEAVNVRVSTIFPMADISRHTIRVKFDLPEGTKAAAGTYAEVKIPDELSPSAERPVVPASAIVWRGGLPMVFVVGENRRTALRLVRLGETLRSGEMVVLSGLHENDQILDKPSPGMTSNFLLP